MKTTICTWVTSLVLREIRVGAPKRDDLLRGEVDDPCEDPARRSRPIAIGDPGAEVGRRRRWPTICTRLTPSIQAAGAEDVAGVALGDALVDDLAVEAGQVERGHGADELGQHDERDLARVRAQVTAEQSDQHGGAFRCVVSLRNGRDSRGVRVNWFVTAATPRRADRAHGPRRSHRGARARTARCRRSPRGSAPGRPRCRDGCRRR